MKAHDLWHTLYVLPELYAIHEYGLDSAVPFRRELARA